MRIDLRPGLAAALALLACTQAHAAPAKPELISALTMPRPAHDVTVSVDGRIFTLMVGPGPSLVEWVGATQKPYPDASWSEKGPGADLAHVLVRPISLRMEPDGLLWVVDTGQEGLAGGGPKLVAFDLKTNTLAKSYPLAAGALPGSIYDDFRFNGGRVYFTDIGHGAIVVLDRQTGALRRTLDGDPSTKGTRPMVAEGKEMPAVGGASRTPDVDMLEVSADGRWLYYQPAAGPLSRIETKWLDDAKASDAERNKHVQAWADTHTTGATAIDAAGNIYASDPDKLRILKIDAKGKMTTLIEDPRLLFVDEMWIDEKGFLWMPPDQLNRIFDRSGPPPLLPFQLFKIQTGQKPVHH